MSAQRTGYGIDLNNRRAMIARSGGQKVEVVKNASDSDSTPCVVAETRGLALRIGQRAANNLISDDENTVPGFYSQLGSSWKFKFQRSGREMSAEQLTAEVLKSLRADVQQRTGEVAESAAIAVPAAFELAQCDAIRKAAQLAGFKESLLLQKPIAAALAYGFQADKEKAYWLVYDFGGGTFDAAVIKSEEGTIQVVNHGGDNFLGGSDIDWAIVERLLVPRLLAEHNLEDFTRGNKQWKHAFAKLKFVAEIAKIDLSRHNRTTLQVCTFEDSDGEEIAFECDLTRGEVQTVAEPVILRSVGICKRILKENRLNKETVGKVILVGGSTLAPSFREILTSQLGIPLDYTVDPLTVVVRGAALFASTQRFSAPVSVPVSAGEYSIDLKYKPVGTDSAPMVGGKVSRASTQDFTGFTLELVNPKTQWRSGKIPLRLDGVFVGNLHAEKGERNTFEIALYDPSGRKQKITPNTLTYTIGIDHIDQPLINSIGIALGNHTVDRLFSKGQTLPLKATRDYRIPRAIRQGTSDVFSLSIVEGESASADSNRFVGTVEIHGDNFRKTIPAAAEVEITFRIDTSRILTAGAYVPALDEEFVVGVQLGIEKVEPDQKELERKRSRSAGECKPLIDAATKDLFRKNAFRITGLSVDATTREVDTHAKTIKLLAELGQDAHAQNSAFPIKPSPSLDEIREAIQKIKDPEKRLIDEFFWFWPEEFGNSQADPAMRALSMGDLETASQIWSAKEEQPIGGLVAKHNLALIFHISALDWENHSVKNEVEAERRQKISDYWKGAFNRWERLATDEAFWEKVTARIRQLNEPNLPTGFARRMRATLPEALDKINAELAVAFAESGKIELARLHIQFMRETNQGLDNVEKTAELVLTPARNRLKEQIQRAKKSAEQNPATAHEAAEILIEHAHPLLEVFDLFFGEKEHFQKELFDEVATTVVNCLVAYQRKTGDNETFVKLLERALPLAESIEVRRRIEENIGVGKGNLSGKELDFVYSLLKSIQDSKESPSVRLARFKRDVVAAIVKAAGVTGLSENYGYLSSTAPDFKELFDSVAIVLRGISLDAWNNHQDQQTAVAANELAVRHATSPELKQRLAEDKATLQQMGAQVSAAAAAQREKSNSTGVGCLVVVAIFIVLGVIGSCNSTNNSSTSTPYTPPAPTYTPPPVAPSAPTYTPPPTFGSGNSGGNTYRVPSSVSSTLASEKAEIETERASIEAFETQIEKLGREIERDRLYIDRTSQSAVDAFNAKVGRYNALSQKAKTENAAFNEMVENYNAKLQRYGR